MRVITLVLLNSALIPLSWGFADEPHMTIMAIAHSQLNDKQKMDFNSITHSFHYDYPDLNDPISQATWFDFIKFEFPHPVDKKLHFEDLQFLGLFHYQTIPYYPENPTNGANTNYPVHPKEDSFKHPGSISALNHIFRSLTDYSNNKDNNKGTCFSWTFQLRILTHIMGDLHQPLHNCDFITKNFPHGTEGGNAIKTHYKFQCSLHYLWDNDFLERKGQFPVFTPDNAKEKAKEIMKKYPKEYFKEKLEHLSGVGNFKQIALESHNLAIQAFKEIPTTFAKDDVYNPSEEYVAMAHEIIEKQIALGGYRLGNLLVYIMDKMPDYIPKMCHQLNESYSYKSSLIYTIVSLSMLPVVTGFFIFAFKKLRSRNV